MSSSLQRWMNVSRNSLAPVFAAIGLLSGSSSAFASYIATAYSPNGTVIGSTTTPGDVTYTSSQGISASSVVRFTTDPFASVSTSISATNFLGQGGYSAGGIMTYSFEVFSTANTYVPIDFSGLYSSFQTGTGPGSLSATSFNIQTDNSSVFSYAFFQASNYGDCGRPPCINFQLFNNVTYTASQSDLNHLAGAFDGTLDILTNSDGKVTGSVQLVANASLDFFFNSLSADSFVDPHLEIDSKFLALNPISTLTLTRGVGNDLPGKVNAVVEPAMFPLTLTGLVALALCMRRRRTILRSLQAS